MKQKPKKKNIDFIKKRTDSLIVSIGDVGNDVNMIRQVNVGLEIFGKNEYSKKSRISISKNCCYLYHYF